MGKGLRRGGKVLTGCTGRSTSYIEENPYRADARLAAQRGDRFFNDPADPRTGYIREQLSLDVGECLYGFGEKFTPFVKNGQTVDIWNADGGTCSAQSYKSIPFCLSSRGYGVFVNSAGRVSFEAASDTVSKLSMTLPGEEIEYYLFAGDTLEDVLVRYTDLTGKPALPPAEPVFSEIPPAEPFGPGKPPVTAVPGRAGSRSNQAAYCGDQSTASTSFLCR